VKDVTPASAYVAMIPLLTETAREVGYALAVHGSLGRDLDLVAVPWTDEAVSAEQLIMRLLASLGYRGAHLLPQSKNVDGTIHRPGGDEPAVKPHGRRAWTIHFESPMYLDVSVMPRLLKGAP